MVIISRRPLKIGNILKLEKKECIILQVLGKGTSSIVYKAKLNNSRNIILKELYPMDLSIFRGPESSLIIPEGSIERFEQYTKRFVKSFELQTDFHNDEETANYTSDIEDIYHINNTLYAVMGSVTGTSYDNIKPENILSIFKVGTALTKAISYYHKKGYFHLDIKPENIFHIPETDELVQLFDFDTVATKEEILKNEFSYSKGYAAPEVRGSQNGNNKLLLS